MNILFIFRVIIGLIFLVSGIEKLLGPYQNFLYVIEHYEILSAPFAKWAAIILPWIELFLGVFTLLGLWTKWMLRGDLVLFAAFILIVGQALIRKLPIGECGCFGELISIPPLAVLGMDITSFVVTVVLLRNLSKTESYSLDRYFTGK
jgi:hypothetical protein